MLFFFIESYSNSAASSAYLAKINAQHLLFRQYFYRFVGRVSEGIPLTIHPTKILCTHTPLWLPPKSLTTRDDLPKQSILHTIDLPIPGVVTSDDWFIWKQQPCRYLEPENVTVVGDTWFLLNNFNYLYQLKSDGTTSVPPIGKKHNTLLPAHRWHKAKMITNGIHHHCGK